MAYDAFDPRLESIVVETRTAWDPAIQKLSDADKQWLAEAIHAQPHLASRIKYERMHTGFCREIEVTVADVERLYEMRVAAR